MMKALCLMALSSAIAMQGAPEPDHTAASASASGLAQQIHNATFMERTPEFTDLYIIQTPDKGRLITIYCNASYCYKRRGVMVNV